MHTRINPKNRAKSTERKESSFMSEPLYLTKLIRNNIDRLYTINNISLTKMLSKGSEKELNHIKRRFKFCSESSSQYAINVEYSKIKSTVIHIMLYLLENKATSDIKSLCKLIKKLKATNEDLTVLAKLIVLIGYYNRLEIVDNNNELEITVNDRIKNYYCFDIAIDFVCFFDVDEVTDDFCSFLYNDILRNKPNLFYLVKNTKMLLLLYCKSKNVLGFLSRTYALHFSKEFIKFFISDLKDNFYYSDFVQKSKTMFAHMNRNIDFLDNLSTNEDKIYDKDSYVLSNGFVMNNNKNNGIKVNGVLLDEKFTMIFSFNLSPSSDNQKEFPIIFFDSSNKTKNAESMEFYIKGNRLMFLSFTGVNLDICQIEKNITYIIYFSIEVYRHLIITVKSLNNTFLYKAEYKARLKKNVSLHVGRDNKNNFEGYIGSIFLYKMIFDDEVKQNLFNLKGTYDKFLYFHSYLTNHIDKYEKNNNTLQDDFTINTNDYNKACNFFRKKDFTNNLICYICPVYEGSKLKKKTYKNNIFKNEFKVSYYIEPRVENGATFFFTNCNFIYEFLKYEGFNFLIFCYELIVSNLNKDSTDEEADNALNFMNSLMKFTMDVFFQINIELYTKEAKMLLFSIRKAITKICERRKLRGEFLEILCRWVITLNSQIPGYSSNVISIYILMRNQFCNIMLNKSLYDLADFSTLEYFLLTFNECLKNQMKGLYTSEVLSLMIGLGDFYLYVNDKVKHEKKFTSLKRIYNDLINAYVKQTENIDFYIQIFESFSGGCELNYKSYQFIKIFYFISGYYYSNIDENRRYQSTKYFIDLYEQLIKNVLPVQITQKEIQIIEAICIRIMFEYPLTEEFFNVDNKKKNNNRKKSLNLTELNFGSNKNLPQIVNNSMSIDNNFIINTNASMAINNAPQSPSHSQSAYIEYETFNSLFLKISVSSNLNDYIIKSIFLVIFECNNNKQIPQEIKMKFILKTKEYSDFLDYNFIGLQFYNHFVYDQFIKIAQMYDNNKKSLGSISYDLFLFLTCQVGNQFQKNKCDKCTLNHFISSKKICERIFRLGLTQSDTFVTTFKFNYEFLIKRILPYTRKSFLFDLIYQLIMIKEKKVFGEELLNRALKLIFESAEKKTKYYYIDKFNLLQLLTKLAKINGKLDINIDDEGINNLFNEEMMRTKFNSLSPNGCIKLLNPKKKIYMENIFDVMVSLSKKTKNLKYIHILEAKFNASKIDLTNKNYFYLSDKKYSQKAAINKLFSSYGNMEIPSFCILMLGKVVKKYYKAKTEEYKTLFKNFAINAFLGAKLIWTEQKEAKSSIKENKDSIEVIEYNKVRQFIDEGIKKKTLNEENLLNVMQSLFDNSKINIDKIIDESSITNNNDNSFCSCSSTKSQKNTCALNKRKKYNIFTKSQKFNISNLLEKDKNDIEEDKRNMTINEQGPNQDFTFINQNNNSIVNYSMINPSNPFSTEIQTSSKSTNIVKTKSINPNIFEITNINSNKQVVLFPKHTLLKRIFSIYFKDILFYSKDFVKMKKYFKYYIEKKDNNGIKQNVDIDNFPDYPTEIKNYTAFKMFYNGLFLRHDFDFFTNEFFKLTHSYYQEQAKEIALKNNRLFIKKSNDEMIEKFVLKIIEEDKFVKRFKCELITNKNVVFGEITITSSFIFFHTMDKEKFLNSISVEEKEEYLLCSYDTDYSKRKKMVIMFKKDISEIMNRRFLYQFQACEIFLLNGKSYFFNFFSEDKKIEFFDHFRVIQKTYSQLKVITDLKEDFRTKDYTRKWLAGKMSNLHYLLMVNKYASRSYNDTNQYPVLPWVTLRDGTLRNLQFSIAAQTEAQKMYLGEKYDMGVTAFPAHYNIHFSNSSFVIYYMVRVNPFTNGQITLQSGKFDAPNRQMHSLDECMMILDRSHDSRELIPQFFISEEFFYNYNCNFYGFRVNDKVVIHNLSGYKYNHPYEYIIHNLEILNSSQVRNSLNFFIDNIFGVGQIGKRDNYNTYDKYCYQELVNLREKIREYIDRNSDYSTIKEKIERKINKIISFGQTPFKLFEEKHKEYSDDNNSSKGDEYNEVGTIISTKAKAKKINLKSKIVFVKASNDYENHPVLYICTLNKSQYQIKFYSDKLKEGKGINKITIQQKIKLLEKIKIFNDEFKYGLKYNPQFILIDYNINLFIICRFKDCSFTLFTNTENCEPKRILTESYITTIMKLPEKMFMTGHHNGKIMEWELKGSSEKGSLYFPDEKVQFKRSLLAHDGPITGIYKEENLGLIITSGEDHMIYIRKYYDLEVLSAIDISNQSCFELKISSNFIYTLLYDEIVKKYTVKMYTMNGSEVHRGDYDYINNMEIDENGNVLVGYFKENVIKVFDATMQKVIKTIEIEEEKTERDAMFMSFVYKEELGGAICIFSNSDIVKVEINY